MKTVRERIMEAAQKLHQPRRMQGPFDAELDESTGLVTIYENGQPTHIMHVKDFLALYDELAPKHGMPTLNESEGDHG